MKTNFALRSALAETFAEEYDYVEEQLAHIDEDDDVNYVPVPSLKKAFVRGFKKDTYSAALPLTADDVKNIIKRFKVGMTEVEDNGAIGTQRNYTENSCGTSTYKEIFGVGKTSFNTVWRRRGRVGFLQKNV